MPTAIAAAAPEAIRPSQTELPAGPSVALATAVLGFFVVTLDAVVVNVALP
jgi:hypothetical protein